MLLKAFFVMMLALGLTGVAAGNLNDPIPNRRPCPYSK